MRLSSGKLATTAKALFPASNHPLLGGQFFNIIGRKVRIRAFGKITTVLTPGNGQFSLYYGSGADATGVLLVQSAAFALTASQTNISWEAEFNVSARSLGSAGTLFATGRALFNEAVAAPHLLIPPSAAVVSGACDLTAASLLSLQFSRSGSTAETMTVQDLEIEAMN